MALHGRFNDALQKLVRHKKHVKKSEITKFAKSAFAINKRPTFLALSIALVLLPGNNYYLDLTLVPKEPFIRSVSLDLPPPINFPVWDTSIKPPTVSARAAIVVDVNSASVLYEKNPNEQLLPASTTKVMTALVALRHFQLNEIVTVKQAGRAIGQTMKLKEGERMRIHDLLYGLLLESGNDAAFALAENFPGGYSAFVEEMNRLALEYYLENTQFRNVSGVDQPGHYTTVKDLARLAAVAMKNPVFSEIVATQERVVTNVEGTIAHPLANRNELLGNVAGIRGVKTGWTEQAGECLVTDTLRDGNEIIAVVLGSRNRFGESAALIEWAYRAHTWVEPRNEHY
ncbi:D-alanyl-D-alanine carboxypeptidase [Patescibacteria group bacterium]|nr:D-alanyl-D-alanine carboxypeptidase [Patescibacteria group bacterium]